MPITRVQEAPDPSVAGLRHQVRSTDEIEFPTGRDEARMQQLETEVPLEVINIETSSGCVPFHFRSDNVADKGVIQQIFVQQDYAIDSFESAGRLREHSRQLVERGMQPLIVDAGANIGASAIYFRLAYPEARVLGVEPHAGNCRIFHRNCDPVGGISLIEGGIASERGTMVLEDPGLDHWGYRVAHRSDGGTSGLEVPVFGVAELLENCVSQQLVPLIVKIDIEGGEAELFSHDTEWITRVPLLIIELHDWMLPGTSNSRNFLRAIGAGWFDVVWRSENLFCFNNELLGTR